MDVRGQGMQICEREQKYFEVIYMFYILIVLMVTRLYIHLSKFSELKIMEFYCICE